MTRCVAIVAWVALLLAPSAAHAQASIPRPRDPSARRYTVDPELLPEDRTAPEPPWVRGEVALIGWLETRTELRSDRFQMAGTDLDDLEDELGLASGGLSPWVELSIGQTWRAGADVSFFGRTGQLRQVERDIVFDGQLIAARGEFAESSLSLLNAAAFAQFYPFYERDFRIGLVGGARYFRLNARVEGARGDPNDPLPGSRVRGELISPFFGGELTLIPFSYLEVGAKIQFMNWSWAEVGLKRADYLDFRIGGRLSVIPERLGIGLEYRYLLVAAEARSNVTRARRIVSSLTAHGLALTLTITF